MQLDVWDYLTFFIIAAGGVGLAVFVLGLPGRIAIARNHPDAEAVNLMGWLGFLVIVSWSRHSSERSSPQTSLMSGASPHRSSGPSRNRSPSSLERKRHHKRPSPRAGRRRVTEIANLMKTRPVLNQ